MYTEIIKISTSPDSMVTDIILEVYEMWNKAVLQMGGMTLPECKGDNENYIWHLNMFTFYTDTNQL